MPSEISLKNLITKILARENLFDKELIENICNILYHSHVFVNTTLSP